MGSPFPAELMVDAAGSRENDLLKIIGGQLRHLNIQETINGDCSCSIFQHYGRLEPDVRCPPHYFLLLTVTIVGKIWTLLGPSAI